MTNWNRVWVIRRVDPTQPGGRVLRKSNATNAFTLKPKRNGRAVAYYTVKHAKRAMTRFWGRCKLFPRGVKAETWPYKRLLSRDHSRWTSQDHLKLAHCAARFRLNSRRLEGDFKVRGKAEAVTLWIAEGAIAGKKGPLPLLLIELKDDSGMAKAYQSGSGTGDPR